jgi:hypothetical protein
MNKFIISVGMIVGLICAVALSCSKGVLSNPPITTLSSSPSPSSSPSSQISGAPETSSSSILAIPSETPNNTGSTTTWDAPLILNQNSDGQTIRVNLVKFIVAAPQGADVMINDIPAREDSDGGYYAFLDLIPGKNIISVKTNSGKSVNLRDTTVTFSPPLFVYLNDPNLGIINNTTDYSKIPINITGYVSKPQAEVKINGIPTSVNPDGTFSFENTFGPSAGSPIAYIKATLGNESDSDELNMFIQNGHIGYIPGVSLLRSTQFGSGYLSAKPGDSIHSTATLRVLKDVAPGTIARFDMGQEIPGIKVMIDPAKFSIYPNIIYSIPVSVQIDKDVAPGSYQSFSLNVAGRLTTGPTAIRVEGPNDLPR